ncbi:carbon-nitrogen hydrolase [Rickenella mellea]|uniref:Carbon-nitrogen hydrolase n=1 Tax=Rickenella mellea TaxID=50990 RepID=A0A4Y7QMN3_9AGAM|nr:carbon-nitrogen hydrolase [Rickenella mellea]
MEICISRPNAPMSLSNIIRAAVIQTCTAAYSLPDTLSKLEHFTKLAREDGAQLAVFPEAFIGGYPKMSTFGTVIGMRTLEGRNEFLRYYNAAVEIPSPSISRIEELSTANNMYLIVGVIEREGGTLYCTVIFVDPAKGYVGKHRKLMPTATERLVWGAGDASTLPVLEKTFEHRIETEQTSRGSVKAKISAAICWENYMPLLRTFYYSEGTQIYCAPTVDARPEWQHTMTHIAIEGRCFVLSACQFSREKDYPPDHPVADINNRNPENIMVGGGSVIISPLGEVLAGPLFHREGILTANLNLDDVIRGKFDLDVVGHYSRPDVFQFRVSDAF